MSNDVHIFRCYPLIIADPIEVEASCREDAEKKAAAQFGCSPRKVIARYVRTLGSRAEHPLEKGLRDGWEKSKAEMAVR